MWACDPALTGEIVSSYHAVGPLFGQALTSFLAAQCALVGDHLWPADATESVLQDPNYDFIVVGAGSAGSVLANRLTEVADWKVLLIEAGENPTLSTEIPQCFYNNIDSPVDWGYKTQPQNGACRSYKKGCAWPRGKVLGGSSSINVMFYVRGNKLDYDEWAADGNDGWSYEEVLPYFKKSENFSQQLTAEDKIYHSNEGYLSVDHSNETHELERLIIKAGTELGLKHVYDINGATQMGICRGSSTTKDGVRHSTARAFLSPIKNRKNLHVMKNAYVTKVLFDNSNTVNGVIVNKNGNDITINARKEIVLSAGSINTPQLLMLSGIGPKKHLEELNIEVKADLPVGENLQDHLYVPVYYKNDKFPGNRTMNSLENISGTFIHYIFEKTGLLSNVSPQRVISFINTTDSKATSPDIQVHYAFLTPSISNFMDVHRIHGYSEEFQQKFSEINEDNFILGAYATLVNPKSKGKILLKSRDPFEYPLIYANYFDHPEDMQTVLKGLKQHTMKLGETEVFKSTGFQLQWIELDSCKKYNKNTDEFLECWARELTTSLYHPTSTVKMGPIGEQTAVVDSELKVKKVKNLRVIDASIIPRIVRGNTNAPTIMIAEKGADMIKKSWSGQQN